MPFDLLPELLLAATALLALVVPLVPGLKALHAGWPALVSVLAALGVAWFQVPGEPALGGVLLRDGLALFFRAFLLAATALTVLVVLCSGAVSRAASGLFCALLLGATLGLTVATATNHLLLLIVALELGCLPTYFLVALGTPPTNLAAAQRDGHPSWGGAAEYILYGAAGTLLMLGGASLLTGAAGTSELPLLGAELARSLAGTGLSAATLLGVVLLFVGLAHKLAAVPFHSWCPDVSEAALPEVAGFLSVAVLGTAVGLLARVAFALAGSAAVIAWLQPALVILAALTCTFANLAAYWQMNLLRLLAYSTVAQVGFLMLGVAALTPAGLSAVLVGLVALLVANLGAFAVVAVTTRQPGMTADFRDLRGLIRRAPVATVALALFLLSLLGLPPLLGCFARVDLFVALFRGPQSGWLYALLAVAAVNTVLAAVYYLGVLRVLILEQRVEDLEGIEPQPVAVPVGGQVYVGVLALLLVGLVAAAGPILNAGRAGADRFAVRSPNPSP